MMQKSLVSSRNLACLAAIAALAWCVSCGGGANDTEASDSAVFISVSVDSDGDFIEAEMVKDVTTTTALATVSVGVQFGDVSVSVGTVRLERYEITYTREDGGSPNVPNVTGSLDGTISVNTADAGVGQQMDVEIDVFPTSHKAFSEFSDSFALDLEPVTFQCEVTVYGRNLAGDQVRATAGFKVQAAAYLPYDDLLPVIASFNQSTQLNVGDDYFAFWNVFNRVDNGYLLLPWGGIEPLRADAFPAGGIFSSTEFLRETLAPGSFVTFPSGVLVAENPFGSVQSDSTDDITIIGPPVEPDPDPVEILEFFSDRNSIIEGETVTLNWVVRGGADSLALLPNEYSGVTVDLSGKNPAFDSVTIAPEFTVRPILRAMRKDDGAFDSEFLSNPIVVSEPPDPPPPPTPEAPEIVFFQPARANVVSGNRTVLFWEVTGDIDRVELLPVSGNRVDVTDVRSFVTQVLIDPGTYVFSLVVYGTDGSIIKQDTIVSVTNVVNQPVEITDISQQPGASIDNGDQGSFRFTVSDPERRDSSYRVTKIAGDSASYFPVSGEIPGGLGDASVAFTDFDDNNNGFVTFEISAYDDDGFGVSSNATRAVELVTFNTTGQLSDTAPMITNFEFVPAGDPGTFPGSQGAIEFTFTDPDTLSLEWSVRIVSGDQGGTLSPPAGQVNTGSGDISVSYVDDPDTPTEPVVFLIRVAEVGPTNPQSDIALLRVEKGIPDDGGTGNPTSEPISNVFSGLYNNLFGGVVGDQQIPNFTLYTNGNILNPTLYQNSDLSGEVLGASLVLDLAHLSGTPSNIVGVDFTRNFAEPSSAVNNSGSFDLLGYFNEPGAQGPPSAASIDNGVARYFMAFSKEDFRENNTAPFNLPVTGARVYTVNATARDSSDNVVAEALNIAVIRP